MYHNGVVYNDRHGGPFDRGAADSYYRRPRSPHFFTGDTYSSEEIVKSSMTQEQIDEYLAGYEWNESCSNHKFL